MLFTCGWCFFILTIYSRFKFMSAGSEINFKISSSNNQLQCTTSTERLVIPRNDFIHINIQYNGTVNHIGRCYKYIGSDKYDDVIFNSATSEPNKYRSAFYIKAEVKGTWHFQCLIFNQIDCHVDEEVCERYNYDEHRTEYIQGIICHTYVIVKEPERATSQYGGRDGRSEVNQSRGRYAMYLTRGTQPREPPSNLDYPGTTHSNMTLQYDDRNGRLEMSLSRGGYDLYPTRGTLPWVPPNDLEYQETTYNKPSGYFSVNGWRVTSNTRVYEYEDGENVEFVCHMTTGQYIQLTFVSSAAQVIYDSKFQNKSNATLKIKLTKMYNHHTLWCEFSPDMLGRNNRVIYINVIMKYKTDYPSAYERSNVTIRNNSQIQYGGPVIQHGGSVIQHGGIEENQNVSTNQHGGIEDKQNVYVTTPRSTMYQSAILNNRDNRHGRRNGTVAKKNGGIFVNQNSTIIKDGVIYSVLGQALQLKCRAGGNPISTQWYRGWDDEKTSINSTSFKLKGLVLRIKQLANDTLGLYECHAGFEGKAAICRFIVKAMTP